ncbi:MAG: MarR family transcriptional regulator [Candidatus Diapherotrites archaeon]|nr:MarR family transcriptional regulator [Candidatus Diapherotrites archaeon]
MQRKIVLGMLLLSIFVFIVAFASFYVQIELSSGDVCGCLIPIPLFIPLLSAIGLFIGMLAFYLIKEPTKEQKPKEESILKLFNSSEQQVLKVLKKHSGKATQAAIVRETGLDKVKVFRIIEKFLAKGIVEKRRFGRTNIVKLSDEFKRLF